MLFTVLIYGLFDLAQYLLNCQENEKGSICQRGDNSWFKYGYAIGFIYFDMILFPHP